MLVIPRVFFKLEKPIEKTMNIIMHVPKVACKLGLNFNKHYKKSWLTKTLDQKLIILTFGQFDHLIILDKLI